MRSLYLSLVKALHPDAERDPAARIGKEEVMKEITSAYEGGDLHTLLRLEMAWLAGESSRLASLDAAAKEERQRLRALESLLRQFKAKLEKQEFLALVRMQLEDEAG